MNKYPSFLTNFMISTMEDKARKNDRIDDKTRWELIPLDCLEDIARVYTEGAKKYGDNTWQNLENGYERYKGALLRHLYAAETKEFDEETKVRHEAAMCFNAKAMLYYAKHGRKIIANQALIVKLLLQIQSKVNESQFVEDYAANLAAQMTEIILRNNIVRK